MSRLDLVKANLHAIFCVRRLLLRARSRSGHLSSLLQWGTRSTIGFGCPLGQSLAPAYCLIRLRYH
jgi:hypothetical protein